MEQVENIVRNMKSQKDVINTEDIYDLLYNLMFKLNLVEALRDIKEGKVMTLEEAKERMRKEYEDFNVR